MKVFDLHCDTLTECEKRDMTLEQNDGQVDYRRGAEFDAWAQVMTAWVPDELRSTAAMEHVERLLAYARRQAAAFPQHFHLVDTAADLDRAYKQHACAVILAVEGGGAMGDDPACVQKLAAMGVKIITLTWNGSNFWADGSLCEGGSDRGLTAAGKAALTQMNACGIIPDVSHLNEQGFYEVAQLTQRPFIASHSLSAAVHTHPRNLSDAQCALLKQADGLIGLNLCCDHLGEQTMEAFERHLVHYLDIGCENILSLGCDLDGVRLRPDWNGVAVLPEIYEFLQRRGYGQRLLDRVFFENADTFFHKALTNRLI